MKVLPFNKTLEETKLAIKASQEAGKIVMGIYNTDFESFLKDDESPVTKADILSNNVIKEILSQSQIPILSEEDKDNKNRLASTKIWIIDPLDGTREFMKKNSEFTIMIGLVEAHKPIMGLIYWPVKNSLYIAQKNQGAYRYFEGNWKKVNVSRVENLKECRLVISRSHLSEYEEEFIKKMHFANYSKMGSSLKALKLCSGEADLYFTSTKMMKQWDTCASYSLITEAGGKMTDITGCDLFYNTEEIQHEKGVVATNGLIHEEFIKECEFLRKKVFGT